MTDALLKVASNKGAPGPDGQTIEALLEHWPAVLPGLQADLLAGAYGPARSAGCGYPRQEAGSAGWGFPTWSTGWSGGRAAGARTAVGADVSPLKPRVSTRPKLPHGDRRSQAASRRRLRVVVDLDLEKFFDLVYHQRLIAKLASASSDRRLLVLIGRMLKAKVVLPDGVVIDSEQGVPQGSPLSPLLSNIVLDELDQELARRGHRFVRYADDAKIYVRSERAGQRVMASLTGFIERRLRLKVNEAKTAVARPEDRHFLGFRLRVEPQTGTVEVLLSERTKRNAMERVRQLTPRNWGARSCVHRPDQRVAARLARVLRDRLGSRRCR